MAAEGRVDLGAMRLEGFFEGSDFNEVTHVMSDEELAQEKARVDGEIERLEKQREALGAEIRHRNSVVEVRRSGEGDVGHIDWSLHQRDPES